MNKHLKLLLFIPIVLSVGLVGCAQNFGANSYAASQIGQAAISKPGKVISKTVVNIKASQTTTQTGTLAGAALGGVGGSALGRGSRAHLAGAVAGALVGGVLGNVASKKLGETKGIRYIVRLTNHKTIAVVQGFEPQLYVGQKVLVLYGNKVRIVPNHH